MQYSTQARLESQLHKLRSIYHPETDEGSVEGACVVSPTLSAWLKSMNIGHVAGMIPVVPEFANLLSRDTFTIQDLLQLPLRSSKHKDRAILYIILLRDSAGKVVGFYVGFYVEKSFDICARFTAYENMFNKSSTALTDLANTTGHSTPAVYKFAVEANLTRHYRILAASPAGIETHAGRALPGLFESMLIALLGGFETTALIPQYRFQHQIYQHTIDAEFVHKIKNETIGQNRTLSITFMNWPKFNYTGDCDRCGDGHGVC